MNVLSSLFQYVEKTKSKRKTPFWKFKFDSNTYWNDFEFSNLKKLGIIVLIFFLFSDYIVGSLFPKMVKFIGSNVNNDIIANQVFYYIVSIYVLILFANRVARGYLPTLNSLINFGVYGTIYFFLIRSNAGFTFIPLDYKIKYIDIIFIGLSIVCVKWSLYFNRLGTNKLSYQFITDKKDQQDIFGYAGLSKELSEFIHHTESEHSFAIGILGNWGDGKTYFSKNLQSDLNNFNGDYIIVDFNPWLYKKEQLIDGFFNEFLTATSYIDRSLKNDITSYIDKISEKSEVEYIQLANFASKILTSFRSSEEIKKSISQKIQLSRKKIIIFLDDTDRLDNDEIKEVLKIIRNCADFANTFFITGIDYNYINSKVDNPSYLEKIFNVLVALPKKSPSSLKNEIKNRFELHFPDDEEITKAILELLQHDWFSNFLKNLRQLNRVINSVKIAYNKLKMNVDVTDLIILETLKNSKTDVYFDIYNDEIIEYDPLAGIAAEDDKESYRTKIKKEENKNEEETYFIQQALNHLLKREGAKHLRAFSNGYALLYFNYANKGIDIIEFYNVLDRSETEIVNKINYWSSRGYESNNEILQLLSLHISKDRTENYKTFVPVLAKIKDYDLASRIFTDVYLKKLQNEPEDSDQVSQKKYQDGLLITIERQITINPLASLEWASNVFLNILRRQKSTDSNSKLSEAEKEQAERIYQQSLSLIVDSNFDFAIKYEAFKKCIVAIKNNIFQYDPECKRIFKKYALKSDQTMTEMLKASVVPYWNNTYDKYNREIIIVDFLSLIFSEKDELLERISNIKSDKINPLISFLKKYINDYYGFRNSSSSFGKYVNDEELHKELLKYFDRKKEQ